jgi:hypothetical protein
MWAKLSREASDWSAQTPTLQLLPMKHRLSKLRLQALARIATTPTYRNILARRKHHPDPVTHTPLQVAEEELPAAADIDAQ